MDNQRRNQSMVYELAAYIFQSMHVASERIQPTRSPMQNGLTPPTHPAKNEKGPNEEEYAMAFH